MNNLILKAEDSGNSNDIYLKIECYDAKLIDEINSQTQVDPGKIQKILQKIWNTEVDVNG